MLSTEVMLIVTRIITTTIYYPSLTATMILRAGYHYLHFTTEEVGAEKVKEVIFSKSLCLVNGTAKFQPGLSDNKAPGDKKQAL